MNSEEYIVDRSAWKSDDPDWVKARKNQWRGIRRSLEYGSEGGAAGTFFYVKKKEFKYLKEYFLTGYSSSKPLFGEGTELYPPPNAPLGATEGDVLFYIWLHADSSDENWNKLRERFGPVVSTQQADQPLGPKGDEGFWWKNGQYNFLRTIPEYPREGQLFGDFDFEGRLYRLFCPTEGIYAPNAKFHKFYGEGPSIDNFQGSLDSCLKGFFKRDIFFSGEEIIDYTNRKQFIGNPNHIVRHGLVDYVQSTLWLLSPENEGFYPDSERDKSQKCTIKHFIDKVSDANLAIEFAEHNQPIYAEVANQLLDLINAETWPEIAQDVMQKGEEQAKDLIKSGW